MPTKMLPLPSFDRLDELLTYDPESGDLRWKINRSNVKAGSLAGCIQTNRKDGRRDWTVRIDGKLYISTRIVWVLYYHHDPGNLTIDHIDRDSLNNRIYNLRLADMHQQCLNTKCTSASTATRYTGLSMHSYKNSGRHPRWVGSIWISRHLYSFGSAAVSSINDDPPDWLIARSSRFYSMRDDPAISDEALISLITG